MLSWLFSLRLHLLVYWSGILRKLSILRVSWFFCIPTLADDGFHLRLPHIIDDMLEDLQLTVTDPRITLTF